jgi:prolyl-tRNA synthetase
MRYSKLLIPTIKEVPAEAEIPSHRLMIRAGFIRKVASGTYTYLLLGWRSMLKIIAIVRQEMDRAGAQEVMMPVVQPMELWKQTGRDRDYGETLGRFQDRHGRMNVLAPTAEEVVTSLAAAEIQSYRQLPVNLYQINTKYRDEFRPRFGVLRSREFIMMDAYSFDVDAAGLEKAYRGVYDAWVRIFRRCGLPYVVVEADSGEIGGTGSHEFVVPCETGEDVIVRTEDGTYAANLEKAEVDPPGTNTAKPPLDSARDLRQAVGKTEEVHTPNVGSIEAVCHFLGTQPAEMIKTLIYSASGRTVAALIRGDHEVNEAKLRRAAPGAGLADEQTIRHATGAAVGFAGPMGLAGTVDLLVIDPWVAGMAAGVTGANKTDYHVRNIVPGRDFPLEGPNVRVADIRNAVEGDRHGGRKLLFSHGIEIGHIFKLGTQYSQKLGAKVLDEGGQTKACVMGCYGIGVNRILASAIEVGNDEEGCLLPVSIAPFEVEVIPLNNDDPAVVAEAERIYRGLLAGGADALMDDRPARPGVKFKDADLIGIPLRVVIGQRGLREGNVEIRRRTDSAPTAAPAAQAVEKALATLGQMKAALTA